MEMVLIYITTKDKAEAGKIGRILLKKRIAGCVNITSGMESLYWWQGKIESSKEAVLIVKTLLSHSKQLMVEVKKNHSSTCPCILVLPIHTGNPDYLKWLADNI